MITLKLTELERLRLLGAIKLWQECDEDEAAHNPVFAKEMKKELELYKVLIKKLGGKKK
jgi:hypothetical protein